jgi:hypothetical protein
MRAAGYYPSNADIDSLMAHVAFLAAMVPDDEAAISSSGGNNSSSSKTEAMADAAAAAAPDAGGTGSRTGSAGSSRLKQADAAAPVGQLQQQQQSQKGWQAAMPAGIDFDTFLCLYVNHRPVTEVSLQQIEQAFSTLGAGTAAGKPVFGLYQSYEPQ